MNEEAAFIAQMVAEPADDTLRLAFADWLDEHDRPDEAQFVRLGCQLEPNFDRYDDDHINTLRNQVNELERGFRDREQDWFRSTITSRQHPEPVMEWRRGFVETLGVPVQWFVAHGVELRSRYPLLKRLVIFRLNGWGERLAACPTLEGIPELELACWYGDADAEALALSPHLSSLKKLVVWADQTDMQTEAFARCEAWPTLQNIQMIEGSYGPTRYWRHLVRRIAPQVNTSVYSFNDELFPFAVGSIGFELGKLPDGRQIIANLSRDGRRLMGWHFDANGRKGEPFVFEWPPEIGLRPQRQADDTEKTFWDKCQRVEAARNEYLHQQTGFVPAFVRVEQFDLGSGFGFSEDEADETDGPRRHNRDVELAWGRTDDSDESPDTADDQNGYGGYPYEWVRRGGFGFCWGDYRWYDRTGHCYMS